MEVAVESKMITEIVDRYDRRIEALIMILQDIQRVYHYLPEEAMRIVAELLQASFSQVFEAATFYRSFSLKPRGRHEVKVCLGTACHLRGGPLILENMERELGVKAGETTSNQAFTLETVNCVGACALAPLVLVDSEYHGNAKPSTVRDILKKYTGK
jgi:NADH:ubiquinone oxidoreductase subunit E